MKVMDMFKLNGRVALVTGGAGKYGSCIAQGLAEAGATVIIASRDLIKCQKMAEEIRKHTRNIKPGSADITKRMKSMQAGRKNQEIDITAEKIDIGSEKSVKVLEEKIVSTYKKIDILVNNAVGRPGGRSGSAVEHWDISMKINATGLFLITRIFLEQMIRQNCGNIINIASMYGMVGQDPRMYEGTGLESDDYGDYFFHKAGMINFTRYLAARYARYNIRVNCISPGGLFANQPEKFLENYTRRVPLGRMANEDDIKGAVVYLASDASSYVTGHNLVVDGGWTIW